MDLLKVLIMHYPATKKRNLLPKKKKEKEKKGERKKILYAF